MKLIDVKNLTIKFGDNKVIEGLTFCVEEADFLCIVGENGSGKTTLIKAITGEINNKAIKYCGLKQKQIGYISQKSKIDDAFPASVMEIVCSGSLNNPTYGLRYSASVRKLALEKLSSLKISKLAKRSFGELSGGQKQKVLLARAMMATDKLIILDEPSNNLDQKSRKNLYDELRKVNEQGVAVIMVTHDLDHDNLIGNKILSLSKHHAFFGKTADYVKEIHHA